MIESLDTYFIRDHHVENEVLRRLHINRAELIARAHERGFDDLDEVDTAVQYSNGTIYMKGYVEGRRPPAGDPAANPGAASGPRVAARLNRFETALPMTGWLWKNSSAPIQFQLPPVTRTCRRRPVAAVAADCEEMAWLRMSLQRISASLLVAGMMAVAGWHAPVAVSYGTVERGVRLSGTVNVWLALPSPARG